MLDDMVGIAATTTRLMKTYNMKNCTSQRMISTNFATVLLPIQALTTFQHPFLSQLLLLPFEFLFLNL